MRSYLVFVQLLSLSTSSFSQYLNEGIGINDRGSVNKERNSYVAKQKVGFSLMGSGIVLLSSDTENRIRVHAKKTVVFE